MTLAFASAGEPEPPLRHPPDERTPRRATEALRRNLELVRPCWPDRS